MRNEYVNICHNPRFSIWPWGTSGFSGVVGPVNYGKSAARWFVQTTAGGGDTVSVSRGTNSSATKYDKWLRGSANMTISISALSTNNALRVRQFQEGFQDFGQNLVALTVIASGPAGASFYFGIGDNYDKITTLGDVASSGTYDQAGTTTLTVTRASHGYATGSYVLLDFTSGTATDGTYQISNVTTDTFDITTTLATTSGAVNIIVPTLVTSTKFFPYDDPVYEHLRITPFESPSTTGTFRLHHVQAEILTDPSKVSDLELRPDWIEWGMMSRYITPIRQGMSATGNSASVIRLPVVAPPGGWRITPVVAAEGRAASYNVTLNSAGTLINNAAPTYGMAVTPAANAMGAVLALGGFTTTAAASQYVIGTEAAPICYLDADYF